MERTIERECNEENVARKGSECRKKLKLKTARWRKIGPLVNFRGSGRRFGFGRGSDVSSMFWRSVVHTEQLFKNVDHSRRTDKKFTSHCKNQENEKKETKNYISRVVLKMPNQVALRCPRTS